MSVGSICLSQYNKLYEESRFTQSLDYNKNLCNSVQVHKSLQRIRERKLAEFIPWGPASIQVTGHCVKDFLLSAVSKFGQVYVLNCYSNVSTLFIHQIKWPKV